MFPLKKYVSIKYNAEDCYLSYTTIKFTDHDQKSFNYFFLIYFIRSDWRQNESKSTTENCLERIIILVQERETALGIYVQRPCSYQSSFNICH